MDRVLCEFGNCSSPAVFCCRGDHQIQRLCTFHLEYHQDMEGNHSICNLNGEEFIISHSEVSMNAHHNDVRFLKYYNKVYFLTLNAVNIKLPDDIKNYIGKCVELFCKKIEKLESTKTDHLKILCKEFLLVLKKFIVNFDFDAKDFYKTIENFYNEVYSGLESFISSKLYELLSSVEKSFNMTPTAKKKFIFTLSIEDEKQRYIAEFFTRINLNCEELFSEFRERFSYFTKRKLDDQRISNNFNAFVRNFDSEKQTLKKNLCTNIAKHVDEILSLTQFQRLSIFSQNLGSPSNEIEFDKWNMLTSQIISAENAKIHSVTELSQLDFLISLVLNKSSFIFYCFDHICKFVHVLPCNDFVIASGSTKDSIIIIQNYPRQNQEYKIVLNSLKFVKNIEINIETFEKVKFCVYIPNILKLIFINQDDLIYSKTLNTESKAKIPIDLKHETCENFTYNREKKIILLKTKSFLRIFNEFMQFLFLINIEGSQLSLISLSLYESRVYLLNENKLEIVTIRLVNEKVREPEFKNYKIESNNELPKCKSLVENYSVRSDLPENTEYAEFYSKLFTVPDLQPDFQAKLESNSNSAEPAPLDFQGNQKEPFSEIQPKPPSEKIDDERPPIPNPHCPPQKFDAPHPSANGLSNSSGSFTAAIPIPMPDLQDLTTIENPFSAGIPIPKPVPPEPNNISSQNPSEIKIQNLLPPPFHNPSTFPIPILKPAIGKGQIEIRRSTPSDSDESLDGDNVVPQNFSGLNPDFVNTINKNGLPEISDSEKIAPVFDGNFPLPNRQSLKNDFSPMESNKSSIPFPIAPNFPQSDSKLPVIPRPNGGSLFNFNPSDEKNSPKKVNLFEPENPKPIIPVLPFNLPQPKLIPNTIPKPFENFPVPSNQIDPSQSKPIFPSPFIQNNPRLSPPIVNNSPNVDENDRSDTESKAEINHALVPKICQEQCELCMKYCSAVGFHKIHLCGNEHNCNMPCEKIGNCGYSGKNECVKIIPEGSQTHEGPHSCSSNFHSCTSVCPECLCYCQKPAEHRDKHESSEHSTNEEGVVCGNNCSNGHFHKVQCNGANECLIGSKLNNVRHLGDFDLVECKDFWNLNRWDLVLNY